MCVRYGRWQQNHVLDEETQICSFTLRHFQGMKAQWECEECELCQRQYSFYSFLMFCSCSFVFVRHCVMLHVHIFKFGTSSRRSKVVTRDKKKTENADRNTATTAAFHEFVRNFVIILYFGGVVSCKRCSFAVIAVDVILSPLTFRKMFFCLMSKPLPDWISLTY